MHTPIRVGLIGLSSTKTKSLAGKWGYNAHYPYLTQSQDYTITALCNSSTDAAERAIEMHGLDATRVRAHGDPVSLSDDPNVDLVVCSVNVEHHYDLCKPALQAGKMVFCEWPLASNLTQMSDLARLATEKKVKTMVGLQGRMGLYVRAIRSLLGDQRGGIGPALSTTITSQAFLLGQGHPQDVAYFTDIRVGGNVVTITGIHLLDTMTATLGEIQSVDAVLKNQRPSVVLVGPEMKVIEKSHANTSHDHMFIHGTLVHGVPFSFQLRGGPPFPGTPVLEWRVYGKKGEIRVTCAQQQLWMGSDVKVQVYRNETNAVQDIDLSEYHDDADPGRGFEAPADNVARLYGAFAKDEVDAYLDFGQSLKWAEFIDNMYRNSGMTDPQ